MPMARRAGKVEIIAAIALRRLGYSYGEIARIIGIGKTTIFKTVEKYPEDLLDRLPLEEVMDGDRDIQERLNRLEKIVEQIKSKMSEIEMKLKATSQDTLRLSRP